METARKVYIELEEHSISKIINGLKILNENGIKYSVLEDSPYPSFEPVSTIPKDTYDKKKMGRHGLVILKLLYEGRSYKEIATSTGISIDGVRYYIKKSLVL